MMHTFHRTFSTATAFLLAAILQVGSVATHAAEIGVGPKSRLFITKTYPGHGKLTDQDFIQLRNAGFTHVVENWNEDVPAFAAGAAKAGLAAMSWNRGMGEAKENDQVDRTMTRLGKPTRFTLPYSKAGWAEITEVVVAHARISLTHPNMKGAILDFEIYDENRTDGFCESYDDATFTAFLREMSKPIPNPLTPPEQRRAFLDQQQILALYIDSQAAKVGERAREMRQAIDAINPSFQMGVYGWGAFKDSVMKNLATESAPVLDCDATLYGRTYWSNAFDGGYDAEEPDAKGLKWGLTTASEMSRKARRRSYPAILLSGHYPQSPGPKDGTQYKFTVRQSFNSAAYADGYWIWTDWVQPEPWKTKQEWIDAMMVYWTEANAALEAGDWTWSSRQQDSVPNPKATALQYVLTTDGSKITLWDPTSGKKVDASAAMTWPTPDPAKAAAAKALEIHGWTVRSVDRSSRVEYQVGHGVCALAFGDVDRITGDELVTLNGGWVKAWDPETQSELLRFYVGPDARDVAIVPALSQSSQ